MAIKNEALRYWGKTSIPFYSVVTNPDYKIDYWTKTTDFCGIALKKLNEWKKN